MASYVPTNVENTIMSALLEEILFDVPTQKIETVYITAGIVKRRLREIIEDEDLSRYIL